MTTPLLAAGAIVLGLLVLAAAIACWPPKPHHIARHRDPEVTELDETTVRLRQRPMRPAP